jgi:hypothetical protein
MECTLRYQPYQPKINLINPKINPCEWGVRYVINLINQRSTLSTQDQPHQSNINNSSYNMKKSQFFALFLLFSSIFATNGSAQEAADKYTLNFRKAMLSLDSSWENPQRMRETVNQFERLANYKKEDWLPRYYHALCLVQLSWSADAKDREAILKAAETAIKAADALSKDNSEIVAIEGYLYQGMIMLNPMSNGPVYGPKSAATLERAMALDPKNPRPHYLLGQNTYFTPAQWGGGMERAKPHLEKAMELYTAAKGATAGEFAPRWGEVPCRMILEGKMGKD